MRWRACYLNFHEVGVCSYLLLQFQLFSFHLWPDHWLFLVMVSTGPRLLLANKRSNSMCVKRPHYSLELRKLLKICTENTRKTWGLISLKFCPKYHGLQLQLFEAPPLPTSFCAPPLLYLPLSPSLISWPWPRPFLVSLCLPLRCSTLSFRTSFIYIYLASKFPWLLGCTSLWSWVYKYYCCSWTATFVITAISIIFIPPLIHATYLTCLRAPLYPILPTPTSAVAAFSLPRSDKYSESSVEIMHTKEYGSSCNI